MRRVRARSPRALKTVADPLEKIWHPKSRAPTESFNSNKPHPSCAKLCGTGTPACAPDRRPQRA